jgi:hypothetical protein
MTMFERLPPTGSERTESQSIASSADSPARTLVSPARGQDCLENEAACGLNMHASFASYDPASLSWKTSQRCFVEGWATFSETWPRAGMTQSGIAFLLPPLVPLTSVIGFGLLPTLGKNEPKGSSHKRYRGSPHFRGAKMSEGLRSGPDDPIYLRPDFAEEVMGFPIGWTELEPLETPSTP